MGPKLKIDLDIAGVQWDNVHGWHDKDGVVLHETISPQYEGLKDLISNSEYLDNKDYGIHSLTDNEGHVAHAYGLGRAIFYHTASRGNLGDGQVNSRKIGIEQISDVPSKYKSKWERTKAWMHMQPELNATGKLIACLSRAHGFRILDDDGDGEGVTTHYEVSKKYDVPGGHVDCHPIHLGGYYPKRQVIALARRYKRLGWHF